MVRVEQALALAARGLSVIPVPPPRPGTPAGMAGDGKTPVLSWKRYQTTPASERQIRQWFRDPQNVAVITGAASGVVVVDPDTEDALRWTTKHLPWTPWQTRTGKGYHLFYRHPGAAVRNRARIATNGGRLAIDVRGDGGFVIGPGSLHASGVVYEEAGDWREPLDALPWFRPEWLAQPVAGLAVRGRRLGQMPGTLPTGDVVDRARRYLARVPRPEIGQGSDAAVLYAAARLVRGFGLPEPDALSLLERWAGGRPGWDRGWLARKVANASRYATEPMGGLR